jgi:fatty acid desaturase
MTTARYRYEHLLHHQHNCTNDDPYWRDWTTDSHWFWPKTRAAALRLFLKDLLGLNMHHIGKALSRWSPWKEHFKRQGPRALTRGERCRLYGFYAALVAGLTIYSGWTVYLLLWALPGSTLTILWVRMRSVAEHLYLPGRNELNRSRHITASWWERLTISPLFINYHIAHHLFPSIPHYNLDRCHQLLLHVPAYREQAAIYDSYFSLGRTAYSDLILRGNKVRSSPGV